MTGQEKQLINIIRGSTEPGKALEVAMDVLEIVRSMSEEQVRRFLPVMQAVKAGDLAGARAIVEGLPKEELNILLACLKAVEGGAE